MNSGHYLQGAYDESAGGAKSGMASLMRRAVQQAKAEAAAQAAAGTGQASHDGLSGDSQKAAETNATRKKALAARLQKAARRMQQEEAKSAGAGQGQEPSTAANQVCFQQADSDASDDLEPTQLSHQDDAENPDQLQMSDLADLQADHDSERSPVKTQSLGNRLGSILKTAFSPSRQSSYIPLDADSPPEANEAPEQVLTSNGRRALPRDASLGQRLGSILKGALSLPRQPSYTSLSGDEDFDSSDPYGDSGRRALPRELSLRERFGSLSRQASSQPDADNAQRVLPRELSLHERYGSMSLSRDPTYSSPVGHSFAGPEGDTESPVPMSPGKRRALPRDASYLPDWVTRTHGQTPRGNSNGNASPRSRLGTSFSSISTSSDHEDDSFVPRWVDWPQSSSLHPQVSSHPAEEEAHDDPTPAAPILQAPPHLRRQQKEVQKAEAALPRAKRPLALASNPLSLSLVHTPSMNPQLDLRPFTPVATPKGQRLFDFWHQKAEQPGTAAGPASMSDIQSKPVTHASQHVHGGAQQLTSSATQQAGSSTGTDVAQLNAAQAPQVAHQADLLTLTQQSDGSHQQPVTATGSMQGLDAGDEQLSTASAVFLAELETASRLVHKQSVQQAELLKGIEHALSQLSEQRLLILDPQAVAVISHQEGVSHNGRLLQWASPTPVLHSLYPTACTWVQDMAHHVMGIFCTPAHPACCSGLLRTCDWLLTIKF